MTAYNLESEINLQIKNLKKMALDGLNLSLSDSQAAAFSLYTHLLIEWNEKVNLTAITDPSEVMIKHFLDSLVFVDRIQKFCSSTKLRLGDLGTGAGFPGIPVKILMPDIEVVLIDALLKRINFLNEMISRLSLSGIQTCHARAEDIGRDPGYRETFDLITARAVAELPVLLEYTAPLLKTGGRLFAAKGISPEDEITSARNALCMLNCEVEYLEKYRLAEGADHRSLVIIKKIGKTSEKYPRQAGKPKKNPL